MPLWPTLFGVNLWLLALGVPLFLAGAARTASTFALFAATLAPLCFAFGLRGHQNRFGQAALLIGVPLLTLLPGADGALADPRLQPRPAVLLQVAMLLAYLMATCRYLARRGVGAGPQTSAAALEKTPLDRPLEVWQVTPLEPKSDSLRLARRILMHRLLIVYTVALPAVLIYAIDLHPANLRALRAAFGTLRRVSAMQASLTAGVAVLTSVLFYFCVMTPLASYLDHHRELRAELSTTRRQARRSRPRSTVYLYMLLALLSMIILILWSLRQ